ncbi:MAG: helix-turn-helix transcriptional regulator [Bacilli bacterium]|jgi:transcriptional regulator with XRE-family HTH domain
MSEIKENIGKNLTELRKKMKLTQAELAAKLNYSDKAISKWEHGDAIPSIENLVEICKFYGITLDQLVNSESGTLKPKDSAKQDSVNKLIVTLLSFVTVWTLATTIYIIYILVYHQYEWIVFIWAIPLSIIILIIFNSIWGKKSRNFFLVSLLIWSLLASVYLNLLIHGYNLWVLFIIGVPATIITILWSKIKLH